MNSSQHINPQDLIIAHMESAGFAVNTDGICAGATIAAIESALNTGDLTYFDNMIQLLCRTPNLLTQVKALQNKLAELALSKSKRELTTDELFLLDTFALLDQMQLYQSPELYHAMFMQTISQHEPQLITSLAYSEKTKINNGIRTNPNWAWSGIYSADQLQTLLSLIQSQILEKDPIAFSIADSKHKIALIHTNNHWLLADINRTPSRIYQHHQLDKLANKLHQIFHERKSRKCVLSFSVFSLGIHYDETNKLLTQLISSPRFASMHIPSTLISNERKHDITTLAQIAITNRQTEYLDQLLKAGLEVNDIVNGHSLCYLAASYGFTDILRLLINKGAHINTATDENVTPLFIATQRQHLDSVSLLLQHHANPNIARDDGATAVTMAVNKRNRELVRLLAQHGADLTSSTPFGTPLEIAATLGCREIQNLLRLLITAKIVMPLKHNRHFLFAKENTSVIHERKHEQPNALPLNRQS